MADIPIPTVAEAGQGVAWFTTQAGLVATVLAVCCGVLMAAIISGVRYFGKQMDGAWVRVTQISDARQADSKAADDALNKNTLALTIVAERLNNRSN